MLTNQIFSWLFISWHKSITFIYLEKVRQSFFGQLIEAQNMGDFDRDQSHHCFCFKAGSERFLQVDPYTDSLAVA